MPPAPSTRSLVVLRGTLARARVAAGTASEHEGLVLDTKEHGRLALVELRGNPFEVPTVGARVGQQVEVEGYVLGSQLRYSRLTAL